MDTRARSNAAASPFLSLSSFTGERERRGGARCPRFGEPEGVKFFFFFSTLSLASFTFFSSSSFLLSLLLARNHMRRASLLFLVFAVLLATGSAAPMLGRGRGGAERSEKEAEGKEDANECQRSCLFFERRRRSIFTSPPCLPFSLSHSLSSLPPFFSPAGGYKAVDGAANDATINEAAKFAVEAVRTSFQFFFPSSLTGFSTSSSLSSFSHLRTPSSSLLHNNNTRPPSPATGPPSSSSASSRRSSRSSPG